MCVLVKRCQPWRGLAGPVDLGHHFLPSLCHIDSFHYRSGRNNKELMVDVWSASTVEARTVRDSSTEPPKLNSFVYRHACA